MNKIVVLFFLVLQVSAIAKNPIIPNKGANDPHIRIIDGKAWLSASHDKSADNTKFIMEDWWLWSSEDLVNWKLESVLKPEDTYIGKPFDGCWATDIVKRNGKWYWYFSERNHQVGVMVADTPQGPWKDPLGKPLLPEDLTPTHEYDMGIFEDTNGDYYIVFGVWDYYIAKLNEDMISLAEKPRKITINNPRGPYNPDGKNKEMPTDDKPFLHYYNGHYYLSWGCFYAMADNVYGPYDCKGSIIEQESFAPGYDAPTWPNGFKQGRHGSFFQWHNQCYFAYCDISQTGNRYFRDTFISYVHYKKNGEIALIRVDGIGVGEYDANYIIEAEDYFKASGVEKKHTGKNRFCVAGFSTGDFLTFNNVNGLEGKTGIQFFYSSAQNAKLEIRENSPDGKLISSCIFQAGKNMKQLCAFKPSGAIMNICFVFQSEENAEMELDAFSFVPKKLTLCNFDELNRKRSKIKSKEKQAVKEFEELLRIADKALIAKPFTVMNKTITPPSGDKHDYMSIGPYWWPNPDTDDGLPYIRKDGEVNPETRTNLSDYVEKSNFFSAVDALGKAFYFSDKKAYAEKAVDLINAWFLDEETKMNPNLDHGQAVPGRSDGRPYGIIEFVGIRNVITTLEVLEKKNALNAKTKQGMKQWLADYAHWLQTSDIGIAERNTKNNHSNWYDVQLCSILIYLNRVEEVKAILENVKNKIALQIEPDGSQPLELARTKSFSYSTMNLSAFTTLAQFGKMVDVDLWNYQTEDGRSIQRAYEFLIPFALNQKEWKYKQIIDLDGVKSKFLKMAHATVDEFDAIELEVLLNYSESFLSANKPSNWKLVFEDEGTGDYKDKWYLDGEIAKVENSADGMHLQAGPEFRNDAHHMVLWTKETFAGDVKIEFDYTRTDNETKCVNILYIQATGKEEGEYKQDIFEWNNLRKVPSMSTYFKNMNLLHISYAAFPNDEKTQDYVRVRHYPVRPDRTFNELEVKPTFFDTGMFKTGVKYHFTVIKADKKLYFEIRGDNKTKLYAWDISHLPELKPGRIGIRHMYTRSALYKNFKVYTK